ncbi:MAG TPA: glycosyltransferase [Opitutaceae bacterium]|nr:glycosyltransferase [Opitutaceae bacterium]
MSRLRIDLFAPPFHGHLHPILGLAEALRDVASIRILTTPDALPAISRQGFETYPILAGTNRAVWEIVNTPGPVRGRPWMLWLQFRRNLRLMPELQAEVARAWECRRPDLAIVDFTLPLIGHWAEQRGIPWWTSHPSPLAIETPDGTPSYLGGWKPPKSMAGRIRDAAGRRTVRLFKRALFALYGHSLRRMGLSEIYRKNGTEAVYSDRVILALGSRELEFPCRWPSPVRFVGPVIATPRGSEDSVLKLDPHRRNVLVTIGTHLPYARSRLRREIRAWAKLSPDLFFHYSAGGQVDMEETSEGENWRFYRYINYATDLPSFDAVVHHGGAGITYHALRAGSRAVVWPQDYDQFDFAARLEWHGLAPVCRRAAEVPSALRKVLAPEWSREPAIAFAKHLSEQNLRVELLALLEQEGFLYHPVA